MNNFRVYYSGACFESGNSPEEVERKVHDKIASMGKILDIEVTALYSDDKDFKQGNYVVSFEAEMTAQAETKELAENQAYDRLSHLGQITAVAFEKDGE